MYALSASRMHAHVPCRGRGRAGLDRSRLLPHQAWHGRVRHRGPGHCVAHRRRLVQDAVIVSCQLAPPRMRRAQGPPRARAACCSLVLHAMCTVRTCRCGVEFARERELMEGYVGRMEAFVSIRLAKYSCACAFAYGSLFFLDLSDDVVMGCAIT